MTAAYQTDRWLDPVITMLDRLERRGGFFVCFPQYRPDLVLDMAHRCGLPLFDFRKEILAPLGWDASTVPLSELDTVITDHAERGSGLVLQNCEALLALSLPETRRQWATRILGLCLSIPVIVPIAVFSGDLPEDGTRIASLDAGRMPDEGLLIRLLGS